jgi:hypothetical protein
MLMGGIFVIKFMMLLIYFHFKWIEKNNRAKWKWHWGKDKKNRIGPIVECFYLIAYN